MSEFLTHYNAPFYVLGGLTLLAMIFWPLGTDKHVSVDRRGAKGPGANRSQKR